MASLLANSIATLVARLLVPAFSFAISVTIARVYGAEMLGVYVQLMALTVIFQTMATAGIPLLLTRDIAAAPEETGIYLDRAQSFALVSGIATTFAFLAYALLAMPQALLWAAAALAITMIPSARMAIQEGFFMAKRAHHRFTFMAFVENALKLALAGTVLVMGKGIVAICAAIAVARLIAVQIGDRLVVRAGEKIRWRFSLPDVRSFGRLVAPFAILLSVSMVYFRIDIILVGVLSTETQAGLYGAAVTLYTISILLLSSVMSAVYPRLSTTFRDSRAGFVQATMLSLKLAALGMVPIALLMICFADWGLVLVFGDDFAGSAAILRILAATLPLHAVNGALGQALQAGQHQGSMVRIVSLGLATHVAGILLLLPLLGIRGAAFSVLVSSTIVTVGTLLSFHRNVAPLQPSLRSALTVAAIVVPIAITLLAPAPWSIPAASLGLVLVIGLVLVGALSKTELDRLLGVVWPSRVASGS